MHRREKQVIRMRESIFVYRQNVKVCMVMAEIKLVEMLWVQANPQPARNLKSSMELQSH